MGPAQTRDIIVVGASLGGVEALTALVGSLPPHLPASVLIVQHISAEAPSLLGQILGARGPLPVMVAGDGMPLERERIYVAPPDRHLLLTADGIRVVFGPRENRTRPAIDPLFRTAAVNYRSRVVGVVLTGTLGDGAAGLLAIHRCGGVALVQRPDDAAYPEMPARALALVTDARQCELREMGALLARLVEETAPEPPPVPEILRVEARLTERAMRSVDWHDVPSSRTDFTCPECHGGIRRVDDDGNGVSRFRCRVGHSYSQQAFISAKDDVGGGALGGAANAAGACADVRDHGARGQEPRAHRLGAESGGARTGGRRPRRSPS